MKRNILLVFVLIVLSTLLAMPFANFVVYKFIFHYSGDWIVPKEISDFTNGLPFIYFLLSPLLFGLWGLGRKWLWVAVSLLPILYTLYYIESETYIWFWSSIFFIVGILLSFIFKKLFRRNATQNSN